MKKGGLHIHLSNRAAYTLIAILVLAIVGVGVYAYANPTTGIGHEYTDIKPCANGEILEVVSGVWACVAPSATEIDPNVLASVKDGVNWNEVTNKPSLLGSCRVLLDTTTGFLGAGNPAWSGYSSENNVQCSSWVFNRNFNGNNFYFRVCIQCR